MGCFSCFDSREEEKLNQEKKSVDLKPTLPPVSSNISKLSSGADRLRSRSNDVQSKRELSSPKDAPGVNIAAHIFTFRELAAATKNFRPECFLGEGGFGRVYKGRLESTGQAVAVKQLDRNGLQGNREFLVEVLMLSLLHHPNLVNLIGYCADGDQRLLVYEFMPLGSLEDHLHDLPPEKEPLDWNTRMKIAAGAAKGLEYLHDKASPPVIYRDFKSSNILLEEGFHPKLSDFGLAKLGPTGDKGAPRVRGASAIDFKSATSGVHTKTMRNELNKLVGTVQDPRTQKAFDIEMQTFFFLFTRYLVEKSRNEPLNWDLIKSPAADQIVPYDKLPAQYEAKNLDKLAVLKVNGGLGTSMGMTGAKSALEVKDDMTFLDLTVRQIEHLNTTHKVDVPLILMTSFNTHEDTLRIIKKYANQQLRITTFNQSRYPRILKEGLLPAPSTAADDKDKWYPPGHGDLYNALLHSGVLDQLIAEGKEYLFVSNSDNLGAVVDQAILEHMIQSEAEFIMEVTDKTKADVKGGTLIDYDGQIRLLEIAQVPSDHVEDFKSIRKFKIFNTNNLWINLKALKKVMSNEGMDLEIIINPKAMSDGQAVIQLETAAGAAIKHFKGHGVNVPRSRFLPVKSCSDLLLIKSDIYSLEHGNLVLNPSRVFDTIPVIKLSDHFKKIAQFQKRFKKIPHIAELDHLTVSGDVNFGRNITLRGTVIVVANEGQRIDIPDGCILENRLLSGNLNMTEL